MHGSVLGLTEQPPSRWPCCSRCHPALLGGNPVKSLYWGFSQRWLSTPKVPGSSCTTAYEARPFSLQPDWSRTLRTAHTFVILLPPACLESWITAPERYLQHNTALQSHVREKSSISQGLRSPGKPFSITTRRSEGQAFSQHPQSLCFVGITAPPCCPAAENNLL